MRTYSVTLLFFTIEFLLSSGNAQVVNDDSIRYTVNEFLLEHNDGKLIDNYCFYDYLNDTCVVHFPKDKTIVGFYGLSSLQLPRYMHLMLIYSNKYYIINMRRPLSVIMDELNNHARQSVLFTDELIKKCIQEVEKLHKFNWEMNHDYAGWSEEDLYNPEEW